MEQRPAPVPAPGEADNDTLAALVAMYRGKAEYRLSRMDEAEATWDEALRLDPAVPEAGWCLQELYYLQGWPGDARRLARNDEIPLFALEFDGASHERHQARPRDCSVASDRCGDDATLWIPSIPLPGAVSPCQAAAIGSSKAGPGEGHRVWLIRRLEIMLKESVQQ